MLSELKIDYKKWALLDLGSTTATTVFYHVIITIDFRFMFDCISLIDIGYRTIESLTFTHNNAFYRYTGFLQATILLIIDSVIYTGLSLHTVPIVPAV